MFIVALTIKVILLISLSSLDPIKCMALSIGKINAFRKLLSQLEGLVEDRQAHSARAGFAPGSIVMI